MTEEQKTADEMPETEDTAEKGPGSELLTELNALGMELATAVTSLWTSEESRQLRREIGDGFVELGRQIDTAIQTAQESETAKQFSEQLKETVVKARESEITTRLEESLVSGLRELNAQLSTMVNSMGKHQATEPKDEPAEADAPDPESEA